MSVIACHQPNFAPWSGYFKKVLSCDVFVLLDDVLPPRGNSRHNYVNRVQFADLNGPFWVTLPIVKRESPTDPISSIQIDRERYQFWRQKFLKSLHSTYARSQFADLGIGLMEEALADEYDLLVKLNIRILNSILSALEISNTTVLSSALHVNTTGSKRLADIVTALQGSAYISGNGALGYMDPHDFSSRGIELKFLNFRHPQYLQQNTREFIGGLSVLDLICNLGAANARELLEN